MYGGRPYHFRYNQKNVWVVVGLCLVALIVYNYARTPATSLETTRLCLLKRVSETSPLKLLTSLDESVERCASQSRLDIRQYPQLDIDYIKTDFKGEKVDCTILSYGDWRLVSPSAMSMLGAARCQYYHMDSASDNKKTEADSSNSMSKDGQLSSNNGEESFNPISQGNVVSDQVKKAMRMEQKEQENDMERDERKRNHGKPTKNKNVESADDTVEAGAVRMDKSSRKELADYFNGQFTDNAEIGDVSNKDTNFVRGKGKNCEGFAPLDDQENEKGKGDLKKGNKRNAAARVSIDGDEGDIHQQLKKNVKREGGRRDHDQMEHDDKRKNVNKKRDKFSDQEQRMSKSKHVSQEMDVATEDNEEHSKKRHKRLAEPDIKAMKEATASDHEPVQNAHQKSSRSKRAENKDRNENQLHNSLESKSNGVSSLKAFSPELKSLLHKATKQSLIHQLLINVPNGLEILAQLLENIDKISTICQVNIVIAKKSEKEMWMFASLITRMLKETTLLPLGAHTSQEKSITRLFLGNTSPKCTDLFSFIEPVVIE